MNERLDVVPGNHLHFIQLPRFEKADHVTILFEAFILLSTLNLDSKSLVDMKHEEHA